MASKTIKFLGVPGKPDTDGLPFEGLPAFYRGETREITDEYATAFSLRDPNEPTKILDGEGLATFIVETCNRGREVPWFEFVEDKGSKTSSGKKAS